jgi:beta-galactosidase
MRISHVLRLAAVVTTALVVGTGANAPQTAPDGNRSSDMGLVQSRRTRISLDDDWRFLKNDVESAERPGLDDTRWRRLDIPHDWAIEGPFDEGNGPGAGALPSYGVAWYRKHFTLPKGSVGQHVEVLFDGAMANARIWLNGRELGARPYGYSSFGFDLTPQIRPAGEDNVLAVRLAPERDSSRWYPGAGLYRHVWLDITDPVHVTRWGTFVTTPRVTDDQATVTVHTEVANAGPRAATFALDTVITDPRGMEVARVTAPAGSIGAGASRTVESSLSVGRPVRWELDRPALYQAVSIVRDGSRELDRSVTRFGIRALAFSATEGVALNGRRMKFQGVCLHHDLGALGSAVSRRAIERQLQTMKAMGANAVRTSHNPPAPELLDLADELGLLVIDEAFDMWGKTKVPNGHGKYFAEWGERDLRDMIRRDRNHPSVMLWSIGNEILEQADADGGAIARRLTAICHEEDPTRLVTAGLNQLDNAIRNGLAAAVDVPGFNYQARHFARVLKEHPGWMIYSAESASTVSSRGVYHLPLEKYQKHPSRQITSFDIIAPAWAYVPDFEFATQDALPQVLGEFVWTGFDYLGEPTPYYGWREPPDRNDWPSRSSYFGIVDLAGFPKDRYFLYQSQWTRRPMVHLLPHWNWEGREGQPVPVMAYTNGEEVELFLNGQSLGRKRKGRDVTPLPVGTSVNDEGTFASSYRLRWDVPYAPGVIRAVAYAGGERVAENSVHTAGAPVRVTLTPDRTVIDADGRDLSFVTVRIEDRAGRLCPQADNVVRFTVTGTGTIAGVDNGDPATIAPFQAETRAAFNGLALLIVRSKARRAGTIAIEAASTGLVPAAAQVVTRVH